MGWYNGVADQLKMDGSSYTLPFRKDWYMLYYNKDLFDKAGVEYPSADMTWDEYEELAKNMTTARESSKVYRNTQPHMAGPGFQLGCTGWEEYPYERGLQLLKAIL